MNYLDETKITLDFAEKYPKGLKLYLSLNFNITTSKNTLI